MIKIRGRMELEMEMKKKGHCSEKRLKVEGKGQRPMSGHLPSLPWQSDLQAVRLIG